MQLVYRQARWRSDQKSLPAQRVAITLSMGEELVFARAEEAGWARARGTSTRLAKTIATIFLTTLVLTTLGIPGSPGLIWLPNIQAAIAREQTRQNVRIKAECQPSGPELLMVFSSSSCDILIFLYCNSGRVLCCGRTSRETAAKAKAACARRNPGTAATSLRRRTDGKNSAGHY